MKSKFNDRFLKIDIFMYEQYIKDFLFIIERGILIKINDKVTIRNFLYHQLKFDQDYINDKIKTIFLNGRVVDNIDSILIENGFSIALSSAMPGLVGVTLGKGSKYASFRKNISFNNLKETVVFDKGKYVTVKMFNLISQTNARIFLEKGILIDKTNFYKISKKIVKLKKIDNFFIKINGINIILDKIDFKIPEYENTLFFVTFKVNKKNSSVEC